MPRGAGDQRQAHTARSGETSASSARRSARPSSAGSPTAPPLGCALRPPTTCGPSTSSSTETADLRRIKLLIIVDEFTREALCVDAVERLVTQRGAPAHLRMDNGPELVSAALRDWCRIWGTHTAYIEPGSPWENPYIESFNGRLRDECLNTEDFADLREAQVVLKDWHTEYNTYRPHQSLAGLTPAAYAAHWARQHQARQLQLNRGAIPSKLISSWEHIVQLGRSRNHTLIV